MFILMNLILLPFAYLKGILVKFQFIFNKKVETPLKHRTVTLFVFIIAGWIIIICNMIVDVVVFVIHLYQPTIRYRKEKSKVEFISSETYTKLQLKFESDAKTGIEVVNFAELSEYMRSAMNIVKLFQKIIFHGSEDLLSLDDQIFLLREYSHVKSTLFAGSIPFGSQLLIYAGVWKYIMKELKVNAKIRSILRSNLNKEDAKNNKRKVNNKSKLMLSIIGYIYCLFCFCYSITNICL